MEKLYETPGFQPSLFLPFSAKQMHNDDNNNDNNNNTNAKFKPATT